MTLLEELIAQIRSAQRRYVNLYGKEPEIKVRMNRDLEKELYESNDFFSQTPVPPGGRTDDSTKVLGATVEFVRDVERFEIVTDA